MPSPPSSDLSGARASEPDEKPTETNAHAAPGSKKGLKFWLIFGSMCVCIFLAALEASSVSTALPTIANELHAEQFTWVGSAYALSSTAYLPMSGGLAQTFGRRPAMLFTLGLFALGSGICGGAKNTNMLIAGRTIQGLGGGGIQSLTGIVLADLVTLRERGVYAAFYGLMFCLAASFAPVVGGTLAARGQWRWLFYLNLPISLVASVLVIFFMDLPIPPGSYREKFMRMDWIGNFLVIASTAAYTVGLTWGGITFPWGSAAVFVPLVLGLVGLGVFIIYEATLAKYPLVPFSLIKSLTSISGYVQAFCCSVTIATISYYFPVYYQACKGASPILSGVYTLSFASIAFTVIVTGFLVNATRRYRPYMWLGWVITVIALGLMSTILATDSLGKSIGYTFLLGCGLGTRQRSPSCGSSDFLALSVPLFLLPTVSFDVLWVWGITIGSTVLQNELAKKLPASFLASVPQGTAIAYTLIPELSSLPLQTRTEVQAAFASSLAVVWRVLASICGAGLFVSFFMKGLSLPDALDADWALKNEKVDPESMP